AMQRTFLDEYRAGMVEHEVSMEEYKASRKRRKKGEAEEAQELPEKPVLRRVVTADVTIEKLGQMLEDNPRGLLVARDELAAWFNSFTRYKGKAGGSDLPAWLEMHRGGTLVIDRKNGDRPTLFIPRAAVGVTGTIQPGSLSRILTPDFF